MHKLTRTAQDTTQAFKVFAHDLGRGLALLSLLTSVGCAHGSASVREARPAAAAGAAEAEQANETSLPDALPYATQVPRGDLLIAENSTRENEAMIRTALSRACQKWGLTPDPRLAQVARAIAQASDGGRLAPRGAFVGYVGQRVGLVEPTPQIWLGAASKASMLAESVEENIRDVANAGGLTHCGGALLTTPTMSVLSVAFSGRFLSLSKAIPRRIAEGAALPLETTLEAPYARPSLAITDAHGAVARVALPARRSIKQTLKLQGTGLHSVEILAEGPQGVAVLAVIPILVGDGPEGSPPAFEAAAAETDAASVLKKLHTLIDQDRKARNLLPLKRDRTLARIALKHSEDMDKNAFVAHTSNTSGTAVDRVERAGLKASLVLENIGRGYSASEIHEGLMASPGHRANLLNPGASHVGLGVVMQREGERVAFLVTELFASFAR